MDIKIVPLGAGQDVGRSCVLVTLNGRNVMFDCGMHMGYNDERRFPDFNFISNGGDCTEILDAVIITHFHLDHCGALPYFTEMVGFDGPIFMTKPTKAIAPILLEDYRKIMVHRKGEENFFTSKMIKDCMKKVVTVNLHETFRIDDDLEVKPYYAGHVLGAAMFYVKAGGSSVVYTGDYNMTPDRHLGAAWIDKCRPDVLISESTYATTIRDSKRSRERDFLKKVFDVVSSGGKVLIPVFALGRAQELCILLETFWQRLDLKVPIYFSAGLTERANDYYKMFINWTNQKIKQTFVDRNMFEFTHISAFDKSYADHPGPQVLFATPGMLHGGTSLDVFCKWAPDPKNMIIMPGYCVAGTVGWKVLQGQKKIEVDGKTVEVRMSVQHLSFSAHADAKGIMQLIQQAQPKNVMLVHGEAKKMAFLTEKIVNQFNVPCYYPENGTTVTIASVPSIPVGLEVALMKRQMSVAGLGGVGTNERRSNRVSSNPALKRTEIDTNIKPLTKIRIDGVLVMARDKPLRLMEAERAMREMGIPSHELCFECRWPLKKTCDLPLMTPNVGSAQSGDIEYGVVHEDRMDESSCISVADSKLSSLQTKVMEHAAHILRRTIPSVLHDRLLLRKEAVYFESLVLSVDTNTNSLVITWAYKDDNAVEHLIPIVRRTLVQYIIGEV
eukprot:CFRG0584T1